MIRSAIVSSMLVGAALPVLAQQPPAPLVSVVSVEMAEIAPTLAVPGTIYSRNDARLTASVGGLLRFVAEPGTRLAEGDTVAAVETAELELQRREQEALLRRARIQLRQLESELARQAELRQTNVVSEFQLEQTTANRDLAAADARIIQVRIGQIDERIRRATTRAPFAGVVTSRARRAGEDVAQGTELAAMTDTETLEVRAFVPLKHLSRTTVGDQLDVFNEDVRLRGTIRALIPTGDIRSQTFEARIDLAAGQEQRAHVGQLVSVAIPIRAAEASLSVPRDALVLRAAGAFVFRINSDLTAEQVPVELGDSSGPLIAISGELNAGDRVAIRGGETLRDGATVRIAES